MPTDRQLTYYDERDSFQAHWQAVQASRTPLALLLDRLTDPRNIGGLFRLADAANLLHIYTFGQDIDLQHKALKRSARATQQYIPHTHLADDKQLQTVLDAHFTIALEVTERSQPYTQILAQPPTLLIIGAENYGVSPQLLTQAQAVAHLPMHGINTSMNVNAAAAIATYHFMHQLRT